MTTTIRRTLLAATLLGIGTLALAMPGGEHRHGGSDGKAGMQAGCGEGMAMQDGEQRGHRMMGGMHPRGDAAMQHRHGPQQPAPAEKAAPAKP